MKHPSNKLAEAALYVIARKGWGQMTLEDVAVKAKISLKMLKSKNDLLPVIVDYMDKKMLANTSVSTGGSLHDRLFEILMARFDAFQEHSKAMLSIFRSIPKDPRAVCAVMPCIRISAAHVIDHCGISGCKTAHTLALFGIMAATTRAFAKDDSADLGKTMAALDQHILRAEKIGLFKEAG